MGQVRSGSFLFTHTICPGHPTISPILNDLLINPVANNQANLTELSVCHLQTEGLYIAVEPPQGQARLHLTSHSLD